MRELAHQPDMRQSRNAPALADCGGETQSEIELGAWLDSQTYPTERLVLIHPQDVPF